MGSLYQYMVERLYTALILHKKGSYYTWWPLCNSLVVNGLIRKFHCTQKKYDVSLAQEFQKHLSNASRKYRILNHGRHKKSQVNKSVQTGSIMCNIINIFSIKTWRCIVQQTRFLDCSFCSTQQNTFCTRVR